MALVISGWSRICIHDRVGVGVINQRYDCLITDDKDLFRFMLIIPGLRNVSQRKIFLIRLVESRSTIISPDWNSHGCEENGRNPRS